MGRKKIFMMMLVLVLSLVNVEPFYANEKCDLQLKCSSANQELVEGQEYIVEVYLAKVMNVDTIFFCFNYDADVLEIVEADVVGKNDWEATINDTNGEMLVDLSGLAAAEDVGSTVLEIKVKALMDTSSTTVNLTDINPAYMGEDLYLDGVSEDLILGIGGRDELPNTGVEDYRNMYLLCFAVSVLGMIGMKYKTMKRLP